MKERWVVWILWKDGMSDMYETCCDKYDLDSSAWIHSDKDIRKISIEVIDDPSVVSQTSNHKES